jgi:antitoxin component of RelBE/YafQ-DinJ toxin-antitoxin module
MLIRVHAKVKKVSEEDLEIQSLDMGTIVQKDLEWVIREIAIPAEEIYRITAYSKTKTMIQLYDRELILVHESFDSVYDKWENGLKPLKEGGEEEENNEESENFTEEEGD